MIALTEAGTITLVSAVISGLTLITVAVVGALLGQGNRKRGAAAAEERAQLKEAVKPANGHPDLGSALHAVEDKLNALSDSVDRLEVKQDESRETLADHVAETFPLTEWVKFQMETEKRKER
jgi:hypothetical protein